MKKRETIINDWGDFICMIGLDFFLMVLGVWALPQLPEHTHFAFAISILLGSIYFTKQILFFIIFKVKGFRKKKEKKK